METIYTVENIYIDMIKIDKINGNEDIITQVRLKLKEEAQFGEEKQLPISFGWCDDTCKILFNFLNAFSDSDTELIIGERILRFEEDGTTKFKVLSTGKILNDVFNEE